MTVDLYGKCFHVRYGYKDARDSYNLETELIEKVGEFLRSNCCDDEEYAITVGDDCVGRRRNSGSMSVGFREEEIKEFDKAREAGVAYMLGNTYIVASEASSIVKKFAINVMYEFLRRNGRSPAISLGIPYTSLIEVSMAYHV